MTESPRRELSPKQAETVERLADAAILELRESGYDGLSVRSVAARASVAPATAYTYFGSKNHLIAEAYWRALRRRERPALTGRSAADRTAEAVRGMARFLSENPELAAAATRALLGPHPDVHALRLRIGAEYLEQFRHAIGDGASASTLDALVFAFVGAIVQAGMGYMTYEEMAERLVAVAHGLLGSAR